MRSLEQLVTDLEDAENYLKHAGDCPTCTDPTTGETIPTSDLEATLHDLEAEFHERVVMPLNRPSATEEEPIPDCDACHAPFWIGGDGAGEVDAKGWAFCGACLTARKGGAQ